MRKHRHGSRGRAQVRCNGAQPERRSRALRRTSAALAAGLALSLWLAAPAAFADEYDPQEAGHPLRIVAYVVHPVGVVLDLLIFRPAHWIVHHEPLAVLFGHERYED